VQGKSRIPDTFGDVVQRCRHNKQLKADAVAEQIGISTRRYSDWENGHGKPRYSQLIKLVRYLSIPVEDIFYPERELMDERRRQMILAVETCSEERLNTLIAIWNGLPPDSTENRE
jgi:transcriptional regulator with XRE-family HTH domain